MLFMSTLSSVFIHGKGCIIILKLQSYSQIKCIGTLKILYFSSLANLTFYRAQLRLLIQDLAYLFVLANNFTSIVYLLLILGNLL